WNRQEYPAAALRDAEAPRAVAPAAVALLQMERHRVMEPGLDAACVERRGNRVALRRPDDVQVIDPPARRRLVRKDDARRLRERREQLVVAGRGRTDRKSTRLNSSHQIISYA